MKKLISSVMCIAVTANIFAGCAANTISSEPIALPVASATAEASSIVTEETQVTAAEVGHYEFKPLVISSIFRNIMGEDKYTAYCNYVEAIRKGEDSFEAKNVETYNWVVGQFPRVCYPVAYDYLDSGYGNGFSNGRGKIVYKTSKEDFAAKNEAFEKQITDILNENLRDDYSDVEKVLALYLYIAGNYTYDWDAAREMEDHAIDYNTPCRFLNNRCGICSECSPAFSYLLLQAGVDATTVKGNRHEWSYVTINGKNYHVDPTYAMESGLSLSYFMMTDEQRLATGDYPKKESSIASQYKDDYNGTQYTADDDFFAPLYKGKFSSWDHEKKIIYYTDENGNEKAFDYSEFGFEG